MTLFPESDDMASFIVNAYMSGKDIICQCEYGQSRSAGCAAAILEYFYGNGISVFSDYSYYPNQLAFHKVYDVLERQKRYYDNRYYFTEIKEMIQKHIEKLQLPETLLDDYCPEDNHSVVDFKVEMEKQMLVLHRLYHTAEEIINALLTTDQPIYAYFTATHLHTITDSYLWETYAVCTYFKY